MHFFIIRSAIGCASFITASSKAKTTTGSAFDISVAEVMFQNYVRKRIIVQDRTSVIQIAPMFRVLRLVSLLDISLNLPGRFLHSSSPEAVLIMLRTSMITLIMNLKPKKLSKSYNYCLMHNNLYRPTSLAFWDTSSGWHNLLIGHL